MLSPSFVNYLEGFGGDMSLKVSFNVSKEHTMPSVFLSISLPAIQNQDVKLLATSLAPCLPACRHASLHGNNDNN